MKQHPEQLGCIFNPNDDIPNETNFARAVTKFGKKKVLKALEARILPPEDQVVRHIQSLSFRDCSILQKQ